MTDPLDQIALLRRLADRGRAGELGADGVQLAAGLDCYFERARLGVTLEEALGVKPAPGGDPFWQVEDRWHRDCLLWEYAKKFLPGGSAAADELGNELRRYNRGAWARDRRQPEMPAAYAGRPRELLFRAFRATEIVRRQHANEQEAAGGHSRKCLCRNGKVVAEATPYWCPGRCAKPAT